VYRRDFSLFDQVRCLFVKHRHSIPSRTARGAAQSFKGVALTIRASQLTEAALVLETMARERERRKVAPAIERLPARYQELTPVLRESIECSSSISR
jgi:hypothetical protein